MAELSKLEKILLVADCLTTAGRTPFHVAVLTVESYHVYPDTFGLHGYEKKYPNANVVISAVVGKRGMAGRGWLKKVKNNTYEITPLGKEYAAALHAGRRKPAKINGHNTAYEKFLQHLSSKRAAELERDGRRSNIQAVDAIWFFDGYGYVGMWKKLTEIAESEENCAGEARALRTLADWMADKFKVKL